MTYFEGGFGLPPDLDTKNLWLALGVQESRIIPGNAKDNFWGAPAFVAVPRSEERKGS